MDDFDRRALLGVAGLASVAALAGRAKAGPLNPPAGPVASTGRTTQEVYDKLAAVAGRIELNQTTAPGDASAMFIITSPGSYYLSGHLSVPPGKSGIRVATHGVTVDLNGYGIVGQNSSTCVNGVELQPFLHQVRVRNGAVRNFRYAGVAANQSEGVVVEDIHAEDCLWRGFEFGDGARVVGCGAYWCGSLSANGTGGRAINVGMWSVVDACNVHSGGSGDGGGLFGIATGADCSVRSCSVVNYGGVGISVGDRSSISSCRVSGSPTYSLIAANHCLVTETLCASGMSGILASTGTLVDRCVASSNAANGIESVGGVVIDSVAAGNTGNGFVVSATRTRMERNTSVGNGTGVRAAVGGCFFAHNACSNNGTNWSLAAGSRGGGVNFPGPGGAVSGNGGPLTATTDAFANWTY